LAGEGRQINGTGSCSRSVWGERASVHGAGREGPLSPRGSHRQDGLLWLRQHPQHPLPTSNGSAQPSLAGSAAPAEPPQALARRRAASIAPSEPLCPGRGRWHRRGGMEESGLIGASRPQPSRRVTKPRSHRGSIAQARQSR